MQSEGREQEVGEKEEPMTRIVLQLQRTPAPQISADN